jgi:hypothetical protein
MAKRLTKQEKWNKASEDLINKMFEIAGHNVTYDDIKGRTDDWYTDWTMTVAQAEQWKEWGMDYLQKNMKLNKKLADIEMRMFNVMYGLNTATGTMEQIKKKDLFSTNTRKRNTIATCACIADETQRLSIGRDTLMH